MRRSLSTKEVLESWRAYPLPFALSALVGVPMLALVWTIPAALILPAFSLAAFAIAAAVAAVSWIVRARRHGRQVTAWDVAGAFVLIGCAAGLFSQPENALQLFGHTLAP